MIFVLQARVRSQDNTPEATDEIDYTMLAGKSARLWML